MVTPNNPPIASGNRMYLTGTHIYCIDMNTTSPKEYLTLPSGETNNYSTTYKEPPEPHGTIGYSKISLNISVSETSSP